MKWSPPRGRRANQESRKRYLRRPVIQTRPCIAFLAVMAWNWSTARWGTATPLCCSWVHVHRVAMVPPRSRGHHRRARLPRHPCRSARPRCSARSHDPVSYPPDVLADDGLASINWFGLDDCDLGGYSLGGRIVLRMLVRRARPARAIVAGHQGLDAINRTTSHSGRVAMLKLRR